MAHDDPTPRAGATPWRVLVLDRSDESDPRWLLATVSLSSDVLPAELDGNRYTGWGEVCEWVRGRLGGQVSLVPVTAIVWRVDETHGSAS
jgi:hypothetical protein